MRHSSLAALGAYALIFLVFFWHIHGGIGQYWDWTFPYFGDQTGGIFTGKDASWTSANGGSPLGYSSDYFFRFFMGLFGFLRPEILHYLLLAGMFAAGAYGMYLLVREHTSRGLAFLLGLAAFINPAIFYKYTAGHFNYFLSFTLFIYLLHYLLHYFQKNLRSSVVVGLLLAFIGFQIQFFVIAGIFVLLFLSFNRQKVAAKYVGVMFALVLLINLVWLMNFLVGAASTTGSGAAAAKVSFKGSSASTFLSIFTFSFSKATLLTRFYAFYELLWNAGLFVFLLWLLTREKVRERFDLALLVFLAVMIFLATGMYQAINLGPLTAFYPMFREVGHFAAVIVLAALVLVARFVRRTGWRWGLLAILVGSLLIVGVKFEYFSQGYSFAAARAGFAPFKTVLDQDKSAYRVLAYPFFDQYVFKGAPSDPPGDLPLKNTGHDSFAAFSRQPFLNNAIPPYQFKDSPQYRLLQTYDIDVLRPYNVKYIFDFSNIYSSNYNLYVPATTYNNNLSLIKNDPHFLDKLLARNPSRLRRMGPHMLEITDPTPRVAAAGSVFNLPGDAVADGLDTFTRQRLGQELDFVRDDKTLAPYTTDLTQLFNSSSPQAADGFRQKLTVPDGRAATLYINQSFREVTYSAARGMLTLTAQVPAALQVDGKAVGRAGGPAAQTLAQVPLGKNAQYFIAFDGSTVAVRDGQTGSLGEAQAGEHIQILQAQGGNVVTNGSFEQGLWEQKVGDCNAYDNNGALAMQLNPATASDGHSSLELSATRHDACTSTLVKLSPQAQYLLSFDYQGSDGGAASFFLGNDEDTTPLARGSQAITGKGWQTYDNIVQTGDSAGNERLFLYALEGDGKTPAVNRYDNVSVVPLRIVQDVTLAAASTGYTQAALQSGQHTFSFADPNYHALNVLTNPSFEQGSWQGKVGDCNAYDSAPNLDMRIDSADKTQGKQSLELSATRHDACVHTSANVQPGADYALSFDYQTDGKANYGYAVSFDDPGATLDRSELTNAASGWHTERATIHVPAHATTATLYLYAFEGNGRSANTVLYDNVQLVRLPDFTNRFFVVQTPQTPLRAPRHTSFQIASQTSRTIQVQGATTPFFVSLSETYHPGWRLELDNAKATGSLARWLPTAAPDAAARHVQLDDTINAWLVDPAQLCSHGAAGCRRESDGSYDLRLVAEFVPQRWFAIGAVVSWTTVIAAAVYLLIVRSKDEPTYRSRS